MCYEKHRKYNMCFDIALAIMYKLEKMFDNKFNPKKLINFFSYKKLLLKSTNK